MANATTPVIQINEGNVGIGVTSPNQKLEVAGNILAIGNIYAYGDANNSSTLATSGNLQLRNSGNTNVNIQSNGNSYLNGGNVGIGTTSPGAKLVVAESLDNDLVILKIENNFGSASVDGSGTALQFYGWDAGITANIKSIRAGQSYSPSALTFETFGGGGTTGSNALSERMRIDGLGNVGIGTTTPGAKLQIAAGGLIVGTSVFAKSSNAYSNGNISLDNGSTDSGGIHFYTGDNTNFGIDVSSGNFRVVENLDESGGSVLMNITTAGAVTFNEYDAGNNTGTPTYLLGTDASGNIVKTNTIPGSGAGPYLPLSAGSTVPLSGELFITNAPGVNVSGAATDQYFLQGKRTGNSGNTFSVYDNNSTAYINSYQSMSFRANHHGGSGGAFGFFGGNVGIGTTSPDTLLHIKGAADDNEALLYVENTHSGGTQYPSAMFTNTNGNHSFGTIAEFRTQNVSGADRPSILFTNGVTTNNWNVGQGVYSANDNFAIGFRTAHPGVASAWADPKLVILTSGNVGIGTTSPLNKTHIVGPTLTRGSETTYGLAISDIGDQTKTLLLGYDLVNDVGIIEAIDQQTAWKNLALGISGDTQVGVGEIAPTAKLHIRSASNDTLIRAYSAGHKAMDLWGATNGSQLTLHGGAEAATIVLDGRPGYNSYFTTGNVGIGTTSPDTKLEIGAAANVAPKLRLTLNDSGNSINPGQEYAGIQWKGNDGQGDGVRADIRVFGGGTSGESYMSFGTMPAGTTASTNAIERMRINPNGNVGIGSAALDAAGGDKLHVDGTLRVGPYFSVSDRDFIKLIPHGTDTKIYSPNERFHIENPDGNIIITPSSSGGVGIGTTSPTQAKLVVSGNVAFNQGDETMGQINPEFERLDFKVDDGVTSATSVAMTLRYYADGARLGIGTTTPDQKLHIKGGDIQTQDTTGSNGVLRIRATITGTPSTGGYPNVGAGDAVIEGGGTTQRHPGVITLMNGDSSISSGQDLGVIQFVGKDDSATGYCTSQIISTTSGAMGAGVSGGGILRFLTSPGNTGATPQEAMRITNTGNVGIGVTSTNSKLEVGGQSKISGNVIIGTETSAGANLFLKDATTTSANSKSLFIVSQNSGRSFLSLVTANSGEAQIGFGTSQYSSQNTSGSIQYTTSTKQFTFKTNFTLALTIANNQAATFTNTVTATNFILSSDKKLKNNIKEIDTSHIDVNWKNFELKSDPGVKRAGVIAQELEEKHPEFVRTDDKGMKSVAYIDLLIAKIAELEARLEKLEK